MWPSTDFVRFAIVALQTTTCLASASVPQTSISFLDHLPAQVHFLPNSQNVLLRSREPQHQLRLWDHSAARLRFIEGTEGKPQYELVVNPLDDAMLLTLGSNRTAYRSIDSGNTWTRISLPAEARLMGNPFHFHSDSKQAIVQGTMCSNASQPDCFNPQSYYTNDITTESPVWTPLPDNLTSCLFAHSSALFRPSATLSTDHIFCRNMIPYNASGSSFRETVGALVQLQAPFTSDNIRELPLEGLEEIKKISFLTIYMLGKHLVAEYFKNTDSSGPSATRIFVTEDGVNWSRTITPALERELGFRELISFDTALGIKTRSNRGSIYRSNKEGNILTEVFTGLGFGSHIERMDGLDGVWMAVSAGSIVSDIGGGAIFDSWNSQHILLSMDDGATWRSIAYPEACHGRKDCSLHLHPRKASYGSSRVLGHFSQSNAPGYVIGVGCPGNGLCDYDSSATYMSRDAGVTWEMINSGPMLDAMGHNGDVIVLAYDSDFVDHVIYSLDGGREWSKVSFNLGFSVKPKMLLSSSKYPSTTFFLFGSLRSVDKNVAGRSDHILISIDFSNVLDEPCEASGYERWHLKNQDGEECVMGRKTSYVRRKAGTACRSDSNSSKSAHIEEHCKCTDRDFECDIDFILNNGTCIPTVLISNSSTNCAQNTLEKFSMPSGYRKIAGNTCEGGIDKAKRIELECSSANAPTGEFEVPPLIASPPKYQVLLQEPQVLPV